MPGAALLVKERGVVRVRYACGLADVDGGVAVVPATNFRLASISKQFTAAVVLLLESEGLLSLDDDVRRFLPELPIDAITLRHLLTHRSGLVDYEDVLTSDAQVRDADVLELLVANPRAYFAPGSAYRYSNSGYVLLGLVAERATGERFADLLRERLFAPLGMHATVAHEEGRSVVTHRAYGHSLIDGVWRRTDQSPTSATLGDGGIYSSIDDLAKWDAALSEWPVLQRAFVPVTETDDAAVRYGFGWRISTHRGEPMVWHSGESIGFRNVLLRFPQSQKTVILLTNRNEPEPYALALAFAAPQARTSQ